MDTEKYLQLKNKEIRKNLQKTKFHSMIVNENDLLNEYSTVTVKCNICNHNTEYVYIDYMRGKITHSGRPKILCEQCNKIYFYYTEFYERNYDY